MMREAYRCNRSERARRRYGHAVNRLDDCRACRRDDALQAAIVDRGSVRPVYPIPRLWSLLDSTPTRSDFARALPEWRRAFVLDSFPKASR